MGIGQARQITNCPTFPLHHRHNCLPDIFFAIAAAAAAEEKQQECNKIIIFQLTNYLRCFVDAGHVNSLLLSFQEVPRYLHSAQSRVDALLLLPVDVCIWDGGTSLGVLAKIRRLRKRNLMNEIREELVAISGGCCCCDQILQTAMHSFVPPFSQDTFKEKDPPRRCCNLSSRCSFVLFGPSICWLKSTCRHHHL